MIVSSPSAQTTRSISIFLAFLTLLAGSAQAQVYDSSPPTDFEPKVRPEVALVSTEGPITIDGALDDPGWEGATPVTGFTEIQPGEMEAPLVRTEAFVTYDESHLYVAFVAHDDPDAIRASMRNRDEIYQDDWVGLYLDTYGNASEAYLVLANPLGVQGDILRSPSGEDAGYDLVYYSAGQITEEGYQVEMAIPFGSLRFPDREEHTWRASLLRNHPREHRRLYSWAALDRDNPCDLCQLGTFDGIEDIQASTSFDLLPSMVGTQAAGLQRPGEPQSGLENGRIGLQPSLNLRYNLSSSLSAEATLNPDFSQVESDAARIDVNSPFALSYPERRPFFQEGSDLFDTWIDVVYTRSINNPIAATKLTGRMGQTSLAYLGAVDERTPLLLPFEERSKLVQAGRSMSNIFRVRRNFGGDSFYGATVTDRRFFDGGGGALVSADLRARFAQHYRMDAQVALSDTREPGGSDDTSLPESIRFGSEDYTAALDGERFQGMGLHFNFSRSTRHLNSSVRYRSHSPTFRTPMGFVTQNNYHSLRASQGVTLYPKGNVVEAVFPRMFFERKYNFEGVHRGDYWQIQNVARLTGQTNIYTHFNLRSERFRDEMYTGLRSWAAEVNSQFSEPVTLGAHVSGGRSLWRSDAPEIGRRFSLSARATFKPLQRLVIQPSVEYAELRELETGDAFFSGYVARTRTSLQLTRELSVRLVTQYNSFNERLDVEPLVTYRLNPFTVFYAGSTHGYGWLGDEAQGTGLYPGLVQTERQFFFKLQYLFRM